MTIINSVSVVMALTSQVMGLISPVMALTSPLIRLLITLISIIIRGVSSISGPGRPSRAPTSILPDVQRPWLYRSQAHSKIFNSGWSKS